MARKARAADSGHVILVVDDQEEVLISVRSMLERAGHRVVTAQSAADALTAMTGREIHMALVDRVMPETSGDDLIRRLRTIDAFLPIVLHTGTPDGSPAELVDELGIQGYHDKAEGPDKLLLWVEAALRTYRTIDRLRRPVDRQRELIAHASHELRSPLQRIEGFADLLLDGSYGELSEEARTPLLAVSRTACDLTRLVTNILTHAKLDARALQVVRGPVIVDDFAREVSATAAALLAGRPVQFVIERSQAPPVLYTDSQALRAIVLNLLDNAVKSTVRGQITLCIAAEGGDARVAISDSGAGITAERLARIFASFRGGSESASAEAGLGLALSQRLALLVGGRLTARSEPGVGSTFVLRLPGAAADDVAADRTPGGYFRPLHQGLD
jgi:signal transduction histidine kinase